MSFQILNLVNCCELHFHYDSSSLSLILLEYLICYFINFKRRRIAIDSREAEDVAAWNWCKLKERSFLSLVGFLNKTGSIKMRNAILCKLYGFIDYLLKTF